MPFKTCGRSAFELCLIRKQEKPGFYDKECLLDDIKSVAHFKQRCKKRWIHLYKSEQQILHKMRGEACCKNKHKVTWLMRWNSFLKIFRKLYVMETTLTPIVPLATWKVFKDRLHDRYFPAKFLKLFRILFNLRDNCDQLPFELPRPLRSNTSPL